MLKFGKFKTSEEILQCKEEIDQNYLDIVNMKLKLIMNQSGNLDVDDNDEDDDWLNLIYIIHFYFFCYYFFLISFSYFSFNIFYMQN